MTEPTNSPALRELSDEALVRRMGETGDRSSFGIIYERYQRRVLSRAYTMVGDPEEAQDLSQEVFLKLFKNAAKYKQQSAFAAWFKVLTYNVVIDELRKTQRIRLVPLPEDDQGLPVLTDDENGIREKRMFEMLHERLMHLLELVPAEEKMMLLMKYRDDIPVKTIADTFGLGESAVKMRLRRGRMKVLELDRSMASLDPTE